jgi:hypothetical protein
VEQPGPFDAAGFGNDGKLLKFLQYPSPGTVPAGGSDPVRERASAVIGEATAVTAGLCWY